MRLNLPDSGQMQAVNDVTFEISVDGGDEWIPLDGATYADGSWELDNVLLEKMVTSAVRPGDAGALAPNDFFLVRAGGKTSDGKSSSFQRSVRQFFYNPADAFYRISLGETLDSMTRSMRYENFKTV